MSDTNDRARSASTITLTAPEGFEFLVRPSGEPKFACPSIGDWFLSANQGPAEALRARAAIDTHQQRFLLKKKNIVVPAAQQYPKDIKVETVASVYGGDVSIPDGWEFVDFRFAEPGESFMDSYRKAIPPIIERSAGSIGPRIIVRKSGNS